MSKLNYSFTAIPNYFWTQGWFKNPKMMIFVMWCFHKCRSEKRRVFHDHKEIELEPFEFIFGRRICSEETGLTEQEIRTLINQLISHSFGGILKKSTNSVTNRFSCYTWVTECFCEISNQQNNQPTTNRQPTDNHKQDNKTKDNLCVLSVARKRAGKIIKGRNMNFDIHYQDGKGKKHFIEENEIIQNFLDKKYNTAILYEAIKITQEYEGFINDIFRYIEGVYTKLEEKQNMVPMKQNKQKQHTQDIERTKYEGQRIISLQEALDA